MLSAYLDLIDCRGEYPCRADQSIGQPSIYRLEFSLTARGALADRSLGVLLRRLASTMGAEGGSLPGRRVLRCATLGATLGAGWGVDKLHPLPPPPSPPPRPRRRLAGARSRRSAACAQMEQAD
eukprot:350561-Chlamydomonas_euryale.AAC.9